jgi:hypothetical protein
MLELKRGPHPIAPSLTQNFITEGPTPREV